MLVNQVSYHFKMTIFVWAEYTLYHPFRYWLYTY